MKNISKRVALCGMLVALAFIFSYVELLIPFSVGIPGVKLGLANLVVLSCIYFMRPQEVLVILVARIFLAGFMFGNMASIIYSLAGGLLSFAVMLLLRKKRLFSMTGVSICGGISHNIGQIIVAIITVSNAKVAFYLPVLLISGAVTGTVVGIVAKSVTGKLNKSGVMVKNNEKASLERREQNSGANFQQDINVSTNHSFVKESSFTNGSRNKYSTIILFAVIVGVAIVSGLMITLFFKEEGSKVRVTIDGVEYGTYDLDSENYIEIENEYGINRIMITGGQVRMTEANCRDQICVNHVPISTKSDIIVCLPHKLVIEIVESGTSDYEFDVIAQ